MNAAASNDLDRSATQRENLLPGCAARTIWISAYAAIVAGVVWLVAGWVLLIESLMAGSTRQPQLATAAFGAFVGFIVLGVLLSYAAAKRLRREMRAGYVTMPYDYRAYELRDPRDGRLLRSRGVPGDRRILSVSLVRWRRGEAK